MLSVNGLGLSVRAMHCKIISWVKFGIRRAAFLKRSIKALSISSFSCLTLRKDKGVASRGWLPAKWVAKRWERVSK